MEQSFVREVGFDGPACEDEGVNVGKREGRCAGGTIQRIGGRDGEESSDKYGAGAYGASSSVIYGVITGERRSLLKRDRRAGRGHGELASRCAECGRRVATCIAIAILASSASIGRVACRSRLAVGSRAGENDDDDVQWR